MEILAHQWFAAREPDFLDAKSKKGPSNPLNLFKRQNFVPLDPGVLVKWHAICTAKVTPVGDRNSQITHRTLKPIKCGHDGIIAYLGVTDWRLRHFRSERSKDAPHGRSFRRKGRSMRPM